MMKNNKHIWKDQMSKYIFLTWARNSVGVSFQSLLRLNWNNFWTTEISTSTHSWMKSIDFHVHLNLSISGFHFHVRYLYQAFVLGSISNAILLNFGINIVQSLLYVGVNRRHDTKVKTPLSVKSTTLTLFHLTTKTHHNACIIY